MGAIALPVKGHSSAALGETAFAENIIEMGSSPHQSRSLAITKVRVEQKTLHASSRI
jgi:hypothetical protein